MLRRSGGLNWGHDDDDRHQDRDEEPTEGADQQERCWSGVARGSSSVASLPGYQFQLGQGAKALDHSATAGGSLFSGKAGKDLTRFGQNLADTSYGTQLQRLLGVSGQGQQALGQQNATVGQGLNGQLQTRTASYGGDMNAAGTIGQGDIAAENAKTSALQNLLGTAAYLGGSALGGGCEFAMHAAKRVLALESYLGLVEVGVGLIPAGGGCKEFALQAAEWAARSATPNDLLAFLQPVFMNIARMLGAGPLIVIDTDVEGLDWEPRLAWQTMKDAGDERTFDAWVDDIEWAAIFSADDELDPSGGEATPTPAPSPESSSEPDADGESSSSSTTISSTPSGLSSTE